MEDLRQVFIAMSKSEVRFLKQFLRAFQAHKPNKALQMVEWMEKDTYISREELALRLYGDAKSRAFLMLKRRLMEKMLETLSLCMGFSFNYSQSIPPDYFHEMQVCRYLQQVCLLRTLGLEELAQEMLEKGQKKAEEWDLPHAKLQTVLMEPISNARANLLEAQLKENLSRNSHESQHTPTWKNFLWIDKGDMEEIHQFGPHFSSQITAAESPSAYSFRTQMQLLHQKMKQAVFTRSFPDAWSYWKEMMENLNTAGNAVSSGYWGMAYIRLAELEISQNHWRHAYEAIVEAAGFFRPTDIVTLKVSLQKAWLSLYVGEWHQIPSLCQELNYFQGRQEAQVGLEIVTLIHIAYLFLSGQTHLAICKLQSLSLLRKDKRGWNTRLRIWEILLLLHDQKWDVATARIETLRKHMAKYPPCSQGMKEVLVYLCQLEKDSFMLKQRVSIRNRGEEHTLNPWSTFFDGISLYATWEVHQREGLPLPIAFLQATGTSHFLGGLMGGEN